MVLSAVLQSFAKGIPPDARRLYNLGGSALALMLVRAEPPRELLGFLAALGLLGWYLADAVAALVVTFFIMKVGLNLVWAAFRELADTAPDREVLDQLRVLAGRVEGVRQVHDMRARHSGSQIFVEIHIVVDAELTVREGHAISRNVKHLLLDEVPDVTRVIVHVDPEMKG